MGQNNDLIFEELREKYDALVWELAREHYKKRRKFTKYDLEGLYQEGLIGLWQVTKTYDGRTFDNASLFVYIRTTVDGYIKNALLSEQLMYRSNSQLTKEKKIKNIMQIKEENGWDWKETQKNSGLSEGEWKELFLGRNQDFLIDSFEKLGYVPTLAERGIEEKFVEDETIEEIMSFLEENLSDTEQQMIKARHIEGLDCEKAAESLEMSRKTFYTKQYRIKNKLKKIERPAFFY